VLSPQGRVRWRSLYSCVRRLRGEAPDALCARRRGRSRRSADSTAAPSNRQRPRGPPGRAASSSCPSTSEFALARMAPRAPSGSHRGDTTHDPSGGSLRQPVPQAPQRVRLRDVDGHDPDLAGGPGAVGDDGDALGFEPRHDARAKRAVGLSLDYQIPFSHARERRGRSFSGRSGRPPTLVRGVTIPKQQEAVQ
jgi:hypothetical protein